MATQRKRGTIGIDKIHEEFFVRTHMNHDHVTHLKGLYEAGVKLPPLIVTEAENKLIEGRHRLAALKALDRKAVEVEWEPETDSGKLLTLALTSNVGGALPPSNADITYAISQMLESGMTHSEVIRNLSKSWPPAVIRGYLQNAASNLTKERVVKAKHAVIEQGLSVNEAALQFKLKPDTLKAELQGKRKKRTSTAEVKGTLTNIFKSRGSSMGAMMRKLAVRYDDGDLSWKQVEDVLEHLERCVRSTQTSVRDWRKRLEAKAGRIEIKKAG
jgi:hypothetical protein